MKRFFWYKLGFVITLLLYSILKLAEFTFADSIATLLYFGSSIMFVFTNETLPTEHLNIPQVHQYYKSRINLYGYVITTVLALSAIIFGVVLVNSSFPVGIVCMVFWFIMIVAVYGYSFFGLNSKVELNSQLDFISRNLNQESRIQKDEVRKILSKFHEKKITNKTELKKFEKEFKEVSFDVTEDVFELYEKYIEETAQELISDEISEI